MDTKALRQKILDLVIRGKLVPQDPNDEPAEVLLERIRVQKQQMLKEGKLKKKDIKNDTIIFKGEDNLHYEKFQDGTVKCIEDEIPFELPEGWCWSRLQSITSILTDGTHKTPQYSDAGYIFLSSKNVTSGKIDWDNIMYIPEVLHRELYTRLAPKAGDILLAKNGTTGVAAIVDREEVFDIYVSLALIRIVDNIVNPLYVLRAIESSFIQNYFNSSLKGIGVPNLHLEHIRKTLIPIPPCTEQDRIILRADTFLSLVEQIATDETELHHLISKAKAKVLDLAIRGKLVPQNPDDEPASILLERIRAEKEELIKQGKIKRDKKESIIFKGEDNSYYFDIPDSWSLCLLKDLFNVCSAKRVRQSDWRTEGVPFYRAREIVKLSDNGFVDNDLFISEEHYMRVKAECGVPEPGDLIVSGVGTIGKVYVVNADDRFYYKDASVLCFENRTGAIDSQFARYMLESEFIQAQMKDNSKGTTVDTITISAAMEYICVLPPLAEQKRIVSAIKTAFIHLKSISEALT